MLTRRSFVLLGLTAPFLMPGQALAALPLPRKDPPVRVRPLGVWALPVRRLEVVQDGGGAVTVDVPLQFKPAINVEAPTMRWWRNIRPRGVPLPPPDPRVITIDPAQQLTITPSMASGLWVDVPITLTVPATIRKGGYRISCEMVDPATRRRASFSFVLNVINRARN
jgi:hypothetical protein